MKQEFIRVINDVPIARLIKGTGLKRDWVNACRSGRIREPSLSKAISVLELDYVILLVPKQQVEELGICNSSRMQLRNLSGERA